MHVVAAAPPRDPPSEYPAVPCLRRMWRQLGPWASPLVPLSFSSPTGADQAPKLRWLGLSDTGLTPTHARLLAAAAKKRRGRGLDAVEVVALANGATAAKQRKEPVI